MAERKIQILAVDDEAHNNELFARTFRPHKQYELHLCNSAEEALDYLASGAATDIVLVDHSMPSMNGSEFVRELVNRGHKQQVVMVTAFPEKKEVIEMWEQGFLRGVIAKPWRAVDLMRTIDRFAARVGDTVTKTS